MFNYMKMKYMYVYLFSPVSLLTAGLH